MWSIMVWIHFHHASVRYSPQVSLLDRQQPLGSTQWSTRAKLTTETTCFSHLLGLRIWVNYLMYVCEANWFFWLFDVPYTLITTVGLGPGLVKALLIWVAILYSHMWSCYCVMLCYDCLVIEPTEYQLHKMYMGRLGEGSGNLSLITLHCSNIGANLAR